MDIDKLSEEEGKQLTSEEVDACFASVNEVVILHPNQPSSDEVSVKTTLVWTDTGDIINTLTVTSPEAALCITKPTIFNIAKQCVRRLLCEVNHSGEPKITQSCATRISPNLCIVCRHCVGNIGSTVAITDSSLAWMQITHRNTGTVNHFYNVLYQDTFKEAFNSNRSNIYDLTLTSFAQQTDNFLIPVWPAVGVNSVVALVVYTTSPREAWFTDTYPNKYPSRDVVTELFAGYRTCVISPGYVLAANTFTICHDASAIPSCCGAPLISLDAAEGTFIGIHIGGRKSNLSVTPGSQVKKYYNVAITTSAPIFMYLYVTQVMGTLHTPAQPLVNQYLTEVRKYVKKFLSNTLPEHEKIPMESLCTMVNSPTAWRDVVQTLDELLG